MALQLRDVLAHLQLLGSGQESPYSNAEMCEVVGQTIEWQSLNENCRVEGIERVEVYKDDDNYVVDCWFVDGPKDDSQDLPFDVSGEDIERLLIDMGLIDKPLEPFWGYQYDVLLQRGFYSYTGE